jgi:signal transduction histidine kinase
MNPPSVFPGFSRDAPPDLLLRLIEHCARETDAAIEQNFLQELILKYAAAEQRLVEINHTKNLFLGIAAHDLRSPLSSIRGLGQILAETETDPERRKSLDTLTQTAQDMITLINDLLDLSTIETGHFKALRLPANLKELIEQRLWIHRTNAHGKHIELVVELQDVPSIPADINRLGQVFDNLVSNAIKFSPIGSTIRLNLFQAHHEVLFEVLDQGPGLTPDDFHKLFREFQKLSAQPTGGEKSSGLGLAIAKRIVEAHLGTLEALNGPNGGALFRCRLPLMSPPPPGDSNV